MRSRTDFTIAEEYRDAPGVEQGTLTAEVRGPLGGEDAHVLLEAVLAAGLALVPPLRGAPYRG
jgi:hypothetical protein